MSKKKSDNQEYINNYYSGEIIKILSKPTPLELGISPERKKSNLSYAEAKDILKHTINRLKEIDLDL